MGHRSGPAERVIATAKCHTGHWLPPVGVMGQTTFLLVSIALSER